MKSRIGSKPSARRRARRKNPPSPYLTGSDSLFSEFGSGLFRSLERKIGNFSAILELQRRSHSLQDMIDPSREIFGAQAAIGSAQMKGSFVPTSNA